MPADLFELLGPPSPEQARRLLLLLRLAPAQRQASPKKKPAEPVAPAA